VEDRATATFKTYRKVREVWTCGPLDMRADRHTDTLIAVLRTGGRGEVITAIVCVVCCFIAVVVETEACWTVNMAAAYRSREDTGVMGASEQSSWTLAES